VTGSGMVLHDTDPRVIEACQRGDPDAFALLFEAHRDRVYSIALRFTSDPAAAMDISQDAFVKLLAHIKDFRSDARFDTWLYRLVVNACIDHQRRKRRWLPGVDDFLDFFSSPRDTVLAEMLKAEAAEHVRETVARLAPEQRMVVVLRYTEGLSYDEIAEILGCSKGTVASRLNRAHKVLERRLVRFRNTGGNGRA